MNTLNPTSASPFQLLTRLDAVYQAAQTDTSGSSTDSWTGLGFRVGQQWFVCDRDEVQELVALSPCTRLPGAKPWFLGIANIRGALLPVTDFSLFLGEEASSKSRSARILIVDAEPMPFGVLVDEVGGQKIFSEGDVRDFQPDTLAAIKDVSFGHMVKDAQMWTVISLKKLGALESFINASV